MKKFRLKPAYLVLILLLAFGVASYYELFSGVENSLQDYYLQTVSKKQTDTRIIIVAVDDVSLEAFGKWPWPRYYHAELINRLIEGKAAAIGIDMIFSEKAEDPEEDAALVDAVKRAGNIVIPEYGSFDKTADAGKLEAKELVEPFPELKAVSTTGHINVIPDNDGIVRRALIQFKYKDRQIKSFAWQIYDEYLKHSGSKADGLKIPKDSWNRSYVDFADSPGNVECVSYSQVIDGTIPPEYFKGKIVLVGPYTVGFQDFYHTSVDKKTPMYGIEIHANIIQNFLRHDFKTNVPFIINSFILVLFTLIAYITFKKLNPAISIAIILGCIAGYFYAARFIYIKGYIISLIYPAALALLVYLVMLAYRYIEELVERKRVTNIFGRYVAPQVVAQILKNGEDGLKLGGIRKEITALFVDIRGFTPMSEKAQPEEVVSILNDYLDLCAQSIFKYEGTLDKFIGDATMAIFNAPLDLEDHAFRAVQTAWAMKQGSELLQKKLIEKFGRAVQFGIGINTGPAVVGNIGSKTRMDYTAIGDTVNTAARLESNAKGGQILLSEVTYELVKDRIEAIYLGEINVKGKTQGVPIYQLEGLR